MKEWKRNGNSYGFLGSCRGCHMVSNLGLRDLETRIHRVPQMCLVLEDNLGGSGS